MNRLDIRTRALHALNDSPTAPQFWELGEMDQVLQEAMEVLAEETDALTQTVYVSLREGDMFYPLQGLGIPLMTPWRLWTRNRSHRLWPTSMIELDGHYERWLTVTGEPEWWFMHSWDCIGIWPPPLVGGGLLEIDAFVWPERLLEETDEPSSPDPDHDFLVRYLEMEGQVKQWEVQRALDIGLELFAKVKDSKARSGLRAVQQRFFGREQGQYDTVR